MQHGPLSSHPIGADVPVVIVGASKASQVPSTSSVQPDKIQPIFVRDIIGYIYLCCRATKQQTETRSFSPMTNAFAGLSQAMREAQSLNLKGSDALDGASLKQILAAANVSPDTWNIIIRQVGASKKGREMLEQANTKGEALALGLPEDASKQFRELEKRLQRENFDSYEMARLAQLEGDFQAKAKKAKPGTKVLLYSVKMGSAYAVPGDGFDKYTAAVGWCLGSAVIKFKGFIASLFKNKQLADQDPVVQIAKNRTWLQPVGTSVKSPTIKSLMKQMSSYSVQTEIKPIPDKKGCILEFSFTTKPGSVPVLIEKIRRQGKG